MRILFNEFKKICLPQYMIIALIVFLFIGFVFPFSLADHVTMMQKMHTSDYPDQIPLDFKQYSVELMFQDMLLERYGSTIEAGEIPAIQQQFSSFSEQAVSAVEKDEVLRRIGLRMDAAFHFVSIYSPDDEPYISEEDQQYGWECSNGVKKLEGTDYPLYFARAFSTLLNTLENRMKEIPDAGSSTVLYDTMSTTLIRSLPDHFMIQLAAILSVFFIVIPYAVGEKRSNIRPLECSAKIGRRSYLYKLAAVVITAILFIGAATILSIFMLKGWDVQRYYHCIIDSAMLSEKSGIDSGILQKCYSGLTFSALYGALLLFQFSCGVCISILTAIVSMHFRNALSALSAGLPFFILPILLFYRYISYALDPSKGILLSKWEPVIVFIFLCVCTLFSIAVVYLRIKKSDI